MDKRIVYKIVYKTVTVGAAGVAFLGLAAGCNPNASTPAASETKPASGNTSSASPSAGSGQYKDGTYQADGNYTSPNGAEKIGVELTLTNDTVTDLTVTPNPTNPQTKDFQGQFISGINSQVVGKNIDDLNVTKVAGSSLTPQGFNDAITKIKAEAAQSGGSSTSKPTPSAS